MRYLHAMVRVKDLDRALDFYCKKLGLKEFKRMENEKGRFTLIFVGISADGPMVELTYNWDQKEDYTHGRNFGHLAFEVDNIYDFCANLRDQGVTISRPPRDGHMAFVRSPDQISIELLQKGQPLPPQEPWLSMANVGEW